MKHGPHKWPEVCLGVKCYACHLGFGTKEIIIESEKFF